MSIKSISQYFMAIAFSAMSSVASASVVCMDAPLLPPVDQSRNIANVSSSSQLELAMDSLIDNTVILLEPGIYQLSNTLWVNRDNITIRGNSDHCDDVVLEGKGMENVAGADSVPHGIWTNRANLKVQNLTIRDVYRHGIIINGTGESPEIFNVRLLDTGEQFIKANPLSFGSGVDNGKVEYSVMQYSAGPPSTDHGGGTGYTNGVDVHAGKNWVIRNNHFDNFHTPDHAQNLWSPAILMWNGSANTLAENNVFVNVDRAISFGLLNRSNDHQGGIIRNNMIVMNQGLYSAARKAESDAAIIVWSSPGTRVFHNTIITNGNLNKSVELRFDSNGAEVRNNLVDASISDRSVNAYQQSNNVRYHGQAVFKDPATGDLRLTNSSVGITDSVPVLPDVLIDLDGKARGIDDQLTDAGASELVVRSAGAYKVQ